MGSLRGAGLTPGETVGVGTETGAVPEPDGGGVGTVLGAGKGVDVGIGAFGEVLLEPLLLLGALVLVVLFSA